MDLSREKLIESSHKNIRDVYCIDSHTLGEGSYGFVRIGLRRSDNKKRAVKIIPIKRIRRPEVLAREIQIMKQVDHPDIIKFYEVYEDSRYVYLVMELCKGGELFDKLIEMGHFSEQQAASLFAQMLSAIAYMHSKNIAHRDLKPENFLFHRTNDFNSLKLIDFGLAKAVDKGTFLNTKTGTCYYVSPETLQGQYNEKCDIWSLGVILFMMLAGYPPFDGGNDREIIERVKSRDFNFGEPIWQKISEPAKDLIRRLLDPVAETRISAEEALSHPWVRCYEQNPAGAASVDLAQLRSYQRSNQFRKAVLNFMAIQCSTDEIQELIELFKRVDRNHDGTLSTAEVLEVLGQTEGVTREKLDELIKSLDSDHSGAIDLGEFLAAMLDKRIYMNEEKLLEAFKRFDINGDGTISPDELRKVLADDNNINHPEIWEEIIREVDIDGDGNISYDEFVTMMEKVCDEEVRAIRMSIE